MSKQEKAKSLWQEYKNNSGLYFYSPKRRAGFVQRVKNLARQVNCKATSGDDVLALMYLGHLEMWLDLELEWN